MLEWQWLMNNQPQEVNVIVTVKHSKETTFMDQTLECVFVGSSTDAHVEHSIATQI